MASTQRPGQPPQTDIERQLTGFKNTAGDYLNPFSTPRVDLSQSDADIERTRALADAYANERHNFQARTDTMAPQQQQAINALGDAAAGRTTSAAETMAKQQSATDAARQFAMASAMKGHSPGSALRAATEGAVQTNAAAAANAATLRAQEQAAARNAYSQAIGGARTQNLQQEQTDDAWRKALIDANVATSGQATSGSNSQNTAKTEEMKAKQEQKGAIFNAIGSAFGISDERAKESVKPASLADALAEHVSGVTFRYKPGFDDGGEHYGLLAHDLEKVMPGVVSRGPDGLRRVEIRHLTMGNTATIAELAKRLKAVEGKAA